MENWIDKLTHSLLAKVVSHVVLTIKKNKYLKNLFLEANKKCTDIILRKTNTWGWMWLKPVLRSASQQGH